MKLSIVTTLYCSAPYIKEFYSRTRRAVKEITDDYEIIFVNDGSPDESLEIAIALYGDDSRVKVIDLSRNFGHHKAMMTGLTHARGDLVFLIDVDLEEEPELLNTFHAVLRNSDADVVYGVQDRRKGGLFERVSGALFYAIFNLLSTDKIPANCVVARLMTRRYVINLVAHKENELAIDGLWVITGFKQVPVQVHKHNKGATTYNPSRKIALMIRSITAFSNKPLIYIAVLGGGILILTFLYFLYVLSVFFFAGEVPSGFTSLILSVWFLGGVTIFSLGVIAIYLSVIFIETKNRPYAIIRHLYDRSMLDGPQ